MVEKTTSQPEAVFYQMQEEGFSKNVLKVFDQHPWVLLQLFGEANFRILEGSLKASLKKRVSEAFNCYLHMQKALREQEDPFTPKNVQTWLGKLPKIGADQLLQQRVLELNYSYRMRPFPFQSGLEATAPPVPLLLELEKRQVDATQALHDYLEYQEDPGEELYGIYTLLMKHRALILSDKFVSWTKVLSKWAGNDPNRRERLTHLLHLMQKALPQEEEAFLPFREAPPMVSSLRIYLTEQTLHLFEKAEGFKIPQEIREELYSLVQRDERARLDFNYAIFYSGNMTHEDYSADRQAYIWVRKLYYYDAIKELRSFDWGYSKPFFKMIFAEDVSTEALEKLLAFLQGYSIFIEEGTVEDAWHVFQWIFLRFQMGEADLIAPDQNTQRINCFPSYKSARALESFVADPENILPLFLLLCERGICLQAEFIDCVKEMYCGEVMQLITEERPDREMLPMRLLQQLDPAPEEADQELFLKNFPRIHRILERGNGCFIVCKPERFHAFALFLSLHPNLDPEQTENLFDWSFREELADGTLQLIQLTQQQSELEIPFALARKFSEIGCNKMLALLSYFIFNLNKATDWNVLTARDLLQCFPNRDGEEVVRIIDTFFNRRIELNKKSSLHRVMTFNRLYSYYFLERGTETAIFDILVKEYHLGSFSNFSRRLDAFFQFLRSWKYDNVEDFTWILSLFLRNRVSLNFHLPPSKETRESCHEQIQYTQKIFAHYADDSNLLLIFFGVITHWDMLKDIHDDSPTRYLLSEIFYTELGTAVTLPMYTDVEEHELFALWLLFANVFINTPELKLQHKKQLVHEFFCREFLDLFSLHREIDLHRALAIVGRLMGALHSSTNYFPLLQKLLEANMDFKEFEKQNLRSLFRRWTVAQILEALNVGEVPFLTKEEKLRLLEEIPGLTDWRREEIAQLPGAQWFRNLDFMIKLNKFIVLRPEEITILFKAQPILPSKTLKKLEALSEEIILDVTYQLNQTRGASEAFQKLVLDLNGRLQVAMKLVKLTKKFAIPSVETELLQKQDNGCLLISLSFVLTLSDYITLNAADVMCFLQAKPDLDEKVLEGLEEITKNYDRARKKITLQDVGFSEQKIWDLWIGLLDDKYII